MEKKTIEIKGRNLTESEIYRLIDIAKGTFIDCVVTCQLRQHKDDQVNMNEADFR